MFVWYLCLQQSRNKLVRLMKTHLYESWIFDVPLSLKFISFSCSCLWAMALDACMVPLCNETVVFISLHISWYRYISLVFPYDTVTFIHWGWINGKVLVWPDLEWNMHEFVSFYLQTEVLPLLPQEISHIFYLPRCNVSKLFCPQKISFLKSAGIGALSQFFVLASLERCHNFILPLKSL